MIERDPRWENVWASIEPEWDLDDGETPGWTLFYVEVRTAENFYYSRQRVCNEDLAMMYRGVNLYKMVLNKMVEMIEDHMKGKRK